MLRRKEVVRLSDYKDREKRLEELKAKYNTDSVYSWSKIDTFNTDKWMYYLRYVLKAPADNKTGAYAVMGGLVHDQLQKFYEEGISNQDMVNNFDIGYDEFVLKGYKFDKTDDQMNDRIAKKYIYCCRHFLERHKKLGGKTLCEPFVPLILQDKNGNNKIIQGYIDFLNNDGEYVRIIDYKTSTMYSQKNQEELSGQLLIYGLAVNQSMKVPIEKIKLYWNFIKYVSVNYLQANGKWRIRHIERNSIGKSLSASIRTWGRKLGYSADEIDVMLNECEIYNSIDNLPDDIKEKFAIGECLVEIEFTQEKALDLANKILKNIEEIEKLEDEYRLTKDESIFWQDVKSYDEYRLANLCDYSPKYHLPYNEYLKNKKKEKYIVKRDELTASDLDDILGL